MWQFIRHPTEVGTPFACSSAVTDKILAHIPAPSHQAHRYLEVGPGTGAFTKRLVEKLGPNDQLDLVEIDAVFSRSLQEMYKDFPNIHVHHMPIQEWSPSYKYDVVIGAVPLNALPSKEVILPILNSYERLTKKEGVLSLVEYIGTSTLRTGILFGEQKKSFQEVVALKSSFFKRHSFGTEKIWKNFPPARVIHCRIQDN